jgi:sialate O-acetylesterase
MLGKPAEMRISLADGSASIPLDGEWRTRLERALDRKTQIPERPFGVGNPNVPSTLYNAFVAPTLPYGIRGAIWYQGEANVGRAEEYRALFPALISDWRARWNQGAFPFLFVQIPDFKARASEPGESEWAEIREAQASALALPNVGMAVTLGLGQADDIHPVAKREVGRRLALIALGKTYGQPVVYEGPTYAGMTVSGDRVRVAFRNGALATSDEDAPRGFQIAGADGRWAWATARIDGSDVLLSAEGVARPTAVRYAWADNPDANLVNRAGLPAAPFRTDGVTSAP